MKKLFIGLAALAFGLMVATVHAQAARDCRYGSVYISISPSLANQIFNIEGHRWFRLSYAQPQPGSWCNGMRNWKCIKWEAVIMTSQEGTVCLTRIPAHVQGPVYLCYGRAGIRKLIRRGSAPYSPRRRSSPDCSRCPRY